MKPITTEEAARFERATVRMAKRNARDAQFWHDAARSNAIRGQSALASEHNHVTAVNNLHSRIAMLRNIAGGLPCLAEGRDDSEGHLAESAKRALASLSRVRLVMAWGAKAFTRPHPALEVEVTA